MKMKQLRKLSGKVYAVCLVDLKTFITLLFFITTHFKAFFYFSTFFILKHFDTQFWLKLYAAKRD